MFEGYGADGWYYFGFQGDKKLQEAWHLLAETESGHEHAMKILQHEIPITKADIYPEWNQIETLTEITPDGEFQKFRSVPLSNTEEIWGIAMGNKYYDRRSAAQLASDLEHEMTHVEYTWITGQINSKEEEVTACENEAQVALEIGLPSPHVFSPDLNGLSGEEKFNQFISDNGYRDLESYPPYPSGGYNQFWQTLRRLTW